MFLSPPFFSSPSLLSFSRGYLLGSSLSLLITRLVFLPTCSRMHFSLGSYWFTGAGEGTESVLVGGQHSVSEKKKAGRSFSWRSAKKRRYLIRLPPFSLRSLTFCEGRLREVPLSFGSRDALLRTTFLSSRLWWFRARPSLRLVCGVGILLSVHYVDHKNVTDSFSAAHSHLVHLVHLRLFSDKVFLFWFLFEFAEFYKFFLDQASLLGSCHGPGEHQATASLEWHRAPLCSSVRPSLPH